MAVQIYQNEELNDLMFQVEALDEWKAINVELGMEKQMSFVSKSESPIPYPWINGSMERIFLTLCPCRVDLKSYDKTPIPLEVLKQIKMSINDKHFNAIEIWYDDKTPDPFAVGITAKYVPYNNSYTRMKDMSFDSEAQAKDYAETTGYEYKGCYKDNERKYLIARWADVVRPLNELKDLAKDRIIENVGGEAKKNLEKLANAVKNLHENAILFLNGEITESELNGTRF